MTWAENPFNDDSRVLKLHQMHRTEPLLVRVAANDDSVERVGGGDELLQLFSGFGRGAPVTRPC